MEINTTIVSMIILIEVLNQDQLSTKICCTDVIYIHKLIVSYFDLVLSSTSKQLRRISAARSTSAMHSQMINGNTIIITFCLSTIGIRNAKFRHASTSDKARTSNSIPIISAKPHTSLTSGFPSSFCFTNELHQTHPSQSTCLHHLLSSIVFVIHNQVNYKTQSIQMDLVLYTTQKIIGQYGITSTKPMNNVLVVLTSASECASVAPFQHCLYFIVNISQSYLQHQFHFISQTHASSINTTIGLSQR